MPSIPARDLRNNVSAVLRRVEAGERLTVTVQGRPVVEIVPLDLRPSFISWEVFSRLPLADPELSDELRDLLPDTTEDIPDPWPT